MRVFVALLLVGLECFGARAGTCTIDELKVLVPNFGYAPVLPTLTGYQIPVELVESAGTIRFDLTNLPIATFAIAGTVSDLQPSGAAYFGTVDAAGVVTIPDVNVEFITLPGADGEFTTQTPATLATGLAVNTLQKRDYPTMGTNLDFTTGKVTLQGAGVIPSVPLANFAVVAGLSVSCTLDPIPDPSKLPPGLSLEAVAAKGKFGKAKKGAMGVVGDTIVVKGTLKQGDPVVDPVTRDLFVRIAGAPGAKSAFLLVRVPANTLHARGKTLSVTDTDGTLIRIVEGQKQVGNDVAPPRGTLVLRTTKKGTAFVLKQTGVDLCRAPASSTLTISLGTSGVSSAVVVKRGGKSTCAQ